MDQDRVCVLDQVMCLSPQISNSGLGETSYAISETLFLTTLISKYGKKEVQLSKCDPNHFTAPSWSPLGPFPMLERFKPHLHDNIGNRREGFFLWVFKSALCSHGAVITTESP